MKQFILISLFLITSLSGQEIEKIQVASLEKNPRKAMVMSAVLPGTGQFYSKAPAWGIVYSAIELAGISGAIYYHQSGNEKTNQYEDFADTHWDVIRWLDDYYGEYHDPYVNAEAAKTHNVFLLVGNRRYTFTEFIQTFRTWEDWQDVRDRIDLEKEYHFYENISKYKQFKQGWDDWRDYKDDPDYQVIQRSSPNQEKYADMRKYANDLLKRSTYFSSAIMFNHLISAFDAYFRTTKYNNQITRHVKVRVIPSVFPGNESITLTMQINLGHL
jgi:hypothetical protein